MKFLPTLSAATIVATVAIARAETPDEIRQRMQEYHNYEEVHQQRIKQEEVAKHRRIWARYGTTEIRRASWKQEADGTWTAEAVFNVFDANPIQPSPKPLWLTSPTAPKRFDQSLDELVAKGIVPLNLARGVKNPYAMGVVTNRIAVNCSALTVNIYSLGSWTGWRRPDGGEPYEELIIDRCSDLGAR